MQDFVNTFHSTFHKVVADISSSFVMVNSANVDHKIGQLLSSLVSLLKVDRAFIFYFSEDLDSMSNTYEECSSRELSYKDNLQNLSSKEFKWWTHQISSNKVIAINSLNELPPEAKQEADILRKMNTQSVMAVPIFVDNKPIGFVGIESVNKRMFWGPEDIDMVRILSNTLAEAHIKLKVETEFYHLSQIQELLMNLAQTYINIPLDLVDISINNSLKEMAEFVSADRSYIFMYNFENNSCSNTYEWCAAGISKEIDNLQDVPLDAITEWVTMHKKGIEFNVSDVSKLEYTGPGCVKDILEPQGIKSIIAVPMRDGDSLVGFVGFDSVNMHHQYSTKEKSLLSFFAQLLVNILKRADSEKKLTNAKKIAEEANRAKSEFIANMSHEIRTPLNSVIGFTELLNKTPLNRAQRKFVENANISAQTLLEIINDILDFSKIEADRLELAPIATNIHDILEQVCDITKYQASQKNLELLLNIDPHTPQFIFTDPIRIKQVLINLISNAIKFTEEGEVEVSVRYNGNIQHANGDKKIGNLIFSIRDTGIGISQEDQKRLFKAFSQADSATTRRFGGTGLGLVISSKIIEKMDSKIELKSAVGKGSTFHFSITTQIFPDIKPNSKNEFKLKRVLVVDDNHNNRVILEKTLKEWGLEVISCNDGLEAIKTIKSSNKGFDVMIIDYNMPLINGVETVKMLNTDSSIAKEKMPIIMMCGSDDSQVINQENSDIGLVYKLVKPIKNRELHDYLMNMDNLEFKSKTHSDFSSIDITSNTNYSVENPSKVAVGQPDSKINILIAEDVQMNMILLKTIINNLFSNVRFIEAFNGNSAVDLFIKHSPEIVIMDIQMPYKDGYEATMLIREYERNNNLKRVPIIALTAGVAKNEKNKAIDAGMDKYLSKPINQDQLKEILNEFLIRPEKENNQLFNSFSNSSHYNEAEMLNRVDNDKELLSELFISLEHEMEETLVELNNFINGGDYQSARKVAHKLKGIALNMSFERLSNLAKEMEKELLKSSGPIDKINFEIIREWETLKRILYNT